MNVMLYALIFALPSALRLFDVMFKGPIWEYVLLINPTQASIEMIMVGFKETASYPFFISLSILVFGGFSLYRFYVLPKFKGYAVRQSGV
jgi:fluoroquinolone transport system permease protein